LKPRGGGGTRGEEGEENLGGEEGGNGPLPQTAGCHVLAVRFTAGRFEGRKACGGGKRISLQ